MLFMQLRSRIAIWTPPIPLAGGLFAFFLRLIVNFTNELILYNDEALMPAARNEVDAIVCLHLKY